MKEETEKLDLTSLQQKLAGKTGKRYWRSLEEAAETPEFRRFLFNEFPAGASEWDSSISRRSILKVMGASMALAGLAGCKRKIDETIVPYVQQPEGLIPGKPLYYATAMTLGGFAQGIIATSHEGRPTKLDGNPDHSATLGSSDVFMQAELLTMYDPDRSKTVKFGDTIKDWDSFLAYVRPRLEAKKTNGSGLRLLTETITSPSVIKQIEQLKAAYPGAKWHQYEPLSRDNIRIGLSSATGKNVTARYDFSKAKVIVSLDCDFLYEEPGHLVYARQFADGRRIRAGTKEMNRLYVIESTPTLTGTVADHRWSMQPSKIAGAASALAGALGGNVADVSNNNQKLTQVSFAEIAGGKSSEALAKNLAAVVSDLQANAGSSIVVAGPSQPPEVHAIVHQINQTLGNVGKTVMYAPPVEADADGTIQELAADMDRGAVDILIILGGNPAYTAPVELDFANKLNKFLTATTVGGLRNLSIRLGLFEDETSRQCQWQLPQTHFLEQWGDARAYDGSVALMQPLIEPLYDGRSVNEVLAMLTSSSLHTGYELVRGYWSAQNLSTAKQERDFDTFWQKSVEKGVIKTPADFNPNPPVKAISLPPAAAESSTGGYEVVFRPDPNIRDGFYANNGWMQELPKPLSKLTWDNAALISPATAKKLGLTLRLDLTTGDGSDMIEIKVGGRTLNIPILILPGQPNDSVTVHLGYGRTFAGRVGTDIGFNAGQIRGTGNQWFATGAQITKIDKTYELVTTHTHQSIAERKVGAAGIYLDSEVIDRASEHDHDHDHDHDHVPDEHDRAEAEHEIDNRKLVRVGTLGDFIEDPLFAKKMDEEYGKSGLTLLPGYNEIYNSNLKWGMSIDMTSCIGCNACVIACQAENNIPVVGKDQVRRGREMHWIRIDTYYETDPNEDPFDGIEHPKATYHQPVPCMQCENAPCELVCPVGATVHSNEGLNDMVYNRCVGTRYCSNNCPYKVRRFNFYQFTDQTTESLKLMQNPDVTVRSRGIMEKCSYCTQRIKATRIEMEKIEVREEDRARAAGDPAEATRILAESARKRQAVLDGLQTACQQACPTRAIIFGNFNLTKEPMVALDPAHTSEIYDLKKHPLNYGLLSSLTTLPRTTYLARIQNPNEQIGKGSAS